MHQGRLIFAQLLDFLPTHEFKTCVQRYGGNKRVRGFSCLDQFLTMTFAQLTGRESLRDIETCLRAFGSKLYHAGFRGTIARSTIADANESRDWRIYADFAQVLIKIARELYADEPFGVDLAQSVYALDATTIQLCLSVFPWALFRAHKGAVKLHTLLDLRGNIPTVIRVTHGKVHEINILDDLQIEPGALYLIDRGYLDFARLHRIAERGAFFITRPKARFDCSRLYSRPVDKSTGLRCDQTIKLNGIRTATLYPHHLRRVKYVDAETGGRLVFITNAFHLEAITIAELYRCRWQVELFFKWIKQHLRLKRFFGTSYNAVCTQIWIAVSVYVLVAIMKKRMQLSHNLYTILQVLSVTLFENTPILQALSLASVQNFETQENSQLFLFDF